MHRLRALLHGDKGAALAEWGLLVVLIAVFAMLAVTIAGENVSETYSEIASTVADAGS